MTERSPPPKGCWFILHGDTSPENYGCVFARIGEDSIEIVHVDNAENECDTDAFHSDGAWFIATHSISRAPDAYDAKEICRALDTVGLDINCVDPEWREVCIADALTSCEISGTLVKGCLADVQAAIDEQDGLICVKDWEYVESEFNRRCRKQRKNV